MIFKRKTLHSELGNQNKRTEKSSNKTDDHSVANRKLRTKRRCLVIYAIIIAAAVTCFLFATNVNTVYTTVSISFSEISKGCNPDGSPFDIYEVLSETVLESACQKLDNKVNSETLKKHISVTGITTDGSFSAIRQNVFDGNDTYSYFPSRYTISYSIISDAIKAEGRAASLKAVLGQFEMPPKSEILSAVAESYKEYYEKKYVTTSDMFNVDWGKTKSLDYFNRANEINNILNRINRYLEKRYDEDVKFVSSGGIGFGDLSAEASRIIDTDVEEYKAFIIQNGITTDKDKLLKQLRYVSQKNYDQMQRSRGEYNIMLEGISIYDPLITKVVFVPALDSENEFYMNRTKIGIDYLTENANAAKLLGDEAESEAQYYDYLIDQFDKFESSEEWKIEEANAKCDRIIAKIDDFLKNVSAINNEYIEKVSYETVSTTDVERGQSIVSSAVVGVKMAVIWSAVIYLLNFAYSLFKRKKSKKEENSNVVA